MGCDLKNSPNCQRLISEIRDCFGYLFDGDNKMRLKTCEDYVLFSGCALTFEHNSTQLWFESDRGGIEFLVASKEAPPRSESGAYWYPPKEIIEFLERPSLRFSGFRERPKSESARLKLIASEFEPIYMRILDFFENGEYHRRTKELEDYLLVSREEFMRQVTEYHARNRTNKSFD